MALVTNDDRAQFGQFVADTIGAALKSLFESKHLYQTIVVDHNPVMEAWQKKAFQNDDCYPMQLFTGRWAVEDQYMQKYRDVRVPGRPAGLRVAPPDVRLFCRECDRTEAFNLVGADDAPWNFSDRPARGDERPDLQVFVLTYQCQGCKSFPSVLLIRRDGLKLSLCGRAPLEHVQVPAVLPKPVRRYFADARIAYNSGQVLAGLFLLRVLVEQWTRFTQPEATGLADELLNSYMATLPTDFCSRFPSLRKLYGDLSVVIHTATPSEDLFLRAAQEIEEHFDARRLFRLDAPR